MADTPFGLTLQRLDMAATSNETIEPQLPTVLVLASGRGVRFRASGGLASKLDAALLGKTVLEHVLQAVRASGLPWHLERSTHQTMGDTIQAAVLATRNAPGWLILPGDLPLISAATLRAVAAALGPGQVVVPAYQGQRGHPVGIAGSYRDALLEIGGRDGARSILQATQQIGQLRELHLDDAGIVTDVDTVAQLAAAEALLRQRRHPDR